MDVMHNPRVTTVEWENLPEDVRATPSGSTLVCDCGLWIHGSAELVSQAYMDHIKVTDPALYDLLVAQDEGNGP
jgi:hypothetical protein